MFVCDGGPNPGQFCHDDGDCIRGHRCVPAASARDATDPRRADTDNDGTNDPQEHQLIATDGQARDPLIPDQLITVGYDRFDVVADGDLDRSGRFKFEFGIRWPAQQAKEVWIESRDLFNGFECRLGPHDGESCEGLHDSSCAPGVCATLAHVIPVCEGGTNDGKKCFEDYSLGDDTCDVHDASVDALCPCGHCVTQSWGAPICTDMRQDGVRWCDDVFKPRACRPNGECDESGWIWENRCYYDNKNGDPCWSHDYCPGGRCNIPQAVPPGAADEGWCESIESTYCQYVYANTTVTEYVQLNENDHLLFEEYVDEAMRSFVVRHDEPFALDGYVRITTADDVAADTLYEWRTVEILTLPIETPFRELHYITDAGAHAAGDPDEPVEIKLHGWLLVE